MPSSRESVFIQNNFLLGERRNGDIFDQSTSHSVETLVNYRVLKGGGLKRRPGIKIIDTFTPFRDGVEVREFIDLSEGYLALTNDDKLYFINKGARREVTPEPFRSVRYNIRRNFRRTHLFPTLGFQSSLNRLENITSADYTRIRTIKEYKDKVIALPYDGLPYFIFIEDDLLKVEPYYIDKEALLNYDSFVRSHPINHEPFRVKDFTFSAQNQPTSGEDFVNLTIGNDADLDVGICKAWLSIDDDKESDAAVVEKVNVSKMALSEFLGKPLICSVYPKTPQFIDEDFKNVVDTDTNEVQVERNKDWDDSNSYDSTLLSDLDSEASISSFSFSPDLDPTGLSKGSKAQLIRELLYGRRYMIVPYSLNLGGYSADSLQDYSTVYPASSISQAAVNQASVTYKLLKSEEETVDDGTTNELIIKNYRLSEGTRLGRTYNSELVAELKGSLDVAGSRNSREIIFYYSTRAGTFSGQTKPVNTEGSIKSNGVVIPSDSFEFRLDQHSDFTYTLDLRL